MNEIEKAIKTIKIAIAEVEWNYPLDYAIAFETAIEALQEKLERDKGCEYCNCSTTEFEITVSDTVDFCKYCPHEKCLNDYGNDDCYGVGFKCIETEHCPKCGRKLGEENG